MSKDNINPCKVCCSMEKTAEEFNQEHINFCGYGVDKCGCCSDIYEKLNEKNLKTNKSKGNNCIIKSRKGTKVKHKDKEYLFDKKGTIKTENDEFIEVEE